MDKIVTKLLLAVFFVSISFISLSLMGQESRLAAQYFRSGEYEKASELYEKLYKENRKSDFYFVKYTNCLIELKEFSKVEKIIQSEIKNKPNDIQLYVTLGNVYERSFKTEEADKQYELAIQRIPADPNLINKLGSSFLNIAKYDLAIKTYEKGQKLLKDENAFSRSLADLYRRSGDKKKMIYYHIQSVETYNNNLTYLKTTLERSLAPEDYKELQAQLYKSIQDESDNISYPELLEWSFIQSKQYSKALRQAKALDRRLEENGTRVYNIGQISFSDKDYDTAIDAYDYITTEKGRNTSYYLSAKRGLLNAKKLKITDDVNHTQEDLLALRMEYESFLNDYGKNSQSAELIHEYADFLAFQLNDLASAKENLELLIDFGGVKKEILAKAKLSLGDIFLMEGDRWESTLLYAQVDKDFKEGRLGEEARYRNALLSYYMGDFEWAQEQFDILKSATTKLISNDAIDKSVFIMDNLGLDTTEVPLMLYANAELLVFQNRYDDAFEKMDTIYMSFPDHGLEDDVYYLKAQIFKKRKEFQYAIEMYEKILEKYNEEIRADNAMFEMAELYEKYLGDLEKAKSLYEQLFLDFSNSTFAVEARKRFRRLRGDEI